MSISPTPAIAGGPRFFALGSGIAGVPSTLAARAQPGMQKTVRFMPLSAYQPVATPMAPITLASLDRPSPMLGRDVAPIFALPGKPDAAKPSLRPFMQRHQGWVWPVPGETRITSPFGHRSDPVHGHAAMHEGIDIAGPVGTKVVAAAAGIVVEAGRKGRIGSFVRIRHGNETTSTYGHLSKVFAQAGQRVAAGEAIGAIGMSGRTTGPHLHFTLHENGELIDPALRVTAPRAFASAKTMEVSLTTR